MASVKPFPAESPRTAARGNGTYALVLAAREGMSARVRSCVFLLGTGAVH